MATANMSRRRGSSSSLSHVPISAMTLTSIDDSRSGPDSAAGAVFADSPTITFQPSHSYSYIAAKSAPTTPGILSRSGSAADLPETYYSSSKSYTHLAFADYSTGENHLKSLSQGFLHTFSNGLAPAHEADRKKARRRAGPHEASEWAYRAGAALTSETRESKGQSWLVQQASSTSLVAMQMEEDGTNNKFAEEAARREHAKALSRSRSRGSRIKGQPGSQASSRMGSRVSSRADLAGLTMTGLPAQTHRRGRTQRSTRSSFDENDDAFARGRVIPQSPGVLGPDFVDPTEEDDGSVAAEEDEEVNYLDELEAERREHRRQEREVAKLTKQNGGWGVGALVDWFVGMSVFPEEEEDEVEEALGQGMDTAAQQGSSSSRPQHESSRDMNRGSVYRDADDDDENADPAAWKDAAWLLGVASKSIF